MDLGCGRPLFQVLQKLQSPPVPPSRRLTVQPSLVQTDGPLVVNAPLASRSQNHFTFSDQAREYWGEDRHPVIRWSRPRTAIVEHCNDLWAQAPEARDV